jgi:hypothetical protein
MIEEKIDYLKIGAQLGTVLAGAVRERRRDMFAAHAMMGMLARPVDYEHGDDPSFGFIAEASYRMADFMITQGDRDKEGGPG